MLVAVEGGGVILPGAVQFASPAHRLIDQILEAHAGGDVAAFQEDVDQEPVAI